MSDLDSNKISLECFLLNPHPHHKLFTLDGWCGYGVFVPWALIWLEFKNLKKGMDKRNWIHHPGFSVLAVKVERGNGVDSDRCPLHSQRFPSNTLIHLRSWLLPLYSAPGEEILPFPIKITPPIWTCPTGAVLGVFLGLNFVLDILSALEQKYDNLNT